jgi:hypothetical protein
MILEPNKISFTIFGFLYYFILILQVKLETILGITLEKEKGQRS